MSVPWAVYQTFSTTDANAPSTPGTSISGAGTFYSLPWSGRNSLGYSLQLQTSGTLTGTFTLWYSDKPNPNLANDNDWTQDAGVTFTNPAGAATNQSIQGTAKAYKKRVKFVTTTGAGVVTGYVTTPRSS